MRSQGPEMLQVGAVVSVKAKEHLRAKIWKKPSSPSFSLLPGRILGTLFAYSLARIVVLGN